MKALTVCEPYASLIADQKKPVENRDWQTAHRGPLAIHAGKSTRYLCRDALRAYPIGKVIAVCRLIACFSVEKAAAALELGKVPKDLKALGWDPAHMRWLLNHEHTEGPFALVLSDVHRLATPIPVVGKQGFWEWDACPDEMLAKVAYGTEITDAQMIHT